MRAAICLLSGLIALSGICHAAAPQPQAFVGQNQWRAVMNKGVRENWASLPIGERTARAGLAMVGTPYKNFTLEIYDTRETPVANFKGMDCWTFFENALAIARLLKIKEPPYSPQDFLRLIELDRYRGGRCNGKFTSRLHHLEDWAQDNEKRGLVDDVTRRLGGVPLKREMLYMGGSGARHFRQLRADPSQIPFMKNVEERLSREGIYYIPKSRVRAIEGKIQDGDIISIVTTWPKSYTSHVGIAVRDEKGVLRFLHASKDEGKVILDSRLSDYLNRYSKHAGIMVTRPKDLR